MSDYIIVINVVRRIWLERVNVLSFESIFRATNALEIYDSENQLPE